MVESSIHVVVIDGGGTKSLLHVYNASGEVVYSQLGPFVNLSVDPVASIDHVEALLNQADQVIPASTWKFLVIAVTGHSDELSFGDVQAKFSQQFNVTTEVMRDIDLAKYACMHQEGVIAIAGTGSIGMVEINNEAITVGGWGHILGDEGSAYQLGLSALKELVLRVDQGVPLTKIDHLLLTHLQVTDVHSIKDVVYLQPKHQVASLATVLGKHSTDPHVARLITDQAHAFADRIRILINRVPLETKLFVHVIGGMFNHISLYRESFERALKENFDHLEIIDHPEAVTIGGWYLYQLRLK